MVDTWMQRIAGRLPVPRRAPGRTQLRDLPGQRLRGREPAAGAFLRDGPQHRAGSKYASRYAAWSSRSRSTCAAAEPARSGPRLPRRSPWAPRRAEAEPQIHETFLTRARPPRSRSPGFQENLDRRRRPGRRCSAAGSPGHYDELRGRPNAAGTGDTALAPLWQRFFSATGRNGWRDLPSRRTSVQRQVLRGRRQLQRPRAGRRVRPRPGRWSCCRARRRRRVGGNRARRVPARAAARGGAGGHLRVAAVC